MAEISNPYQRGPGLRTMGNSPSGPRVNAEDFGAGNARDLDRLGRQVERAGGTLAGFGIKMYEEQSQNEARQLAINYETDIDRYRQQIFTDYTGSKAYLTVEDLTKYSDGQAKAMAKNLSTPRARELFQQYRDKYDAQNKQLAHSHIIQQNAAMETATLKGRNQLLTNQAALWPEEDGAVRQGIAEIKANNAKLYANMPTEVLALENQKSIMAVVEAIAASEAKQFGAAKAVGFLESADIVEELSDKGIKAQVDALKRQYQQAGDLDIDIQWAQNLAGMDDVTPGEVMALVLKEYKDNPQRAKLITDLYSQFKTDKVNAEKAKEAQIKSDAYVQVATTGYEISKIPEEIRVMRPDLYRSLAEHCIWYRSMADKMDPDMAWTQDKLRLSPIALQSWLEGAPEEEGISNYDLLFRKCGNDTARLNEILGRIKSNNEKIKSNNADAVNGAASFDVGNWFEVEYSSMFDDRWIQAWGDPANYDPKSQEAKSRKNAFWVKFQSRLAMEEQTVLKRKASPTEQEELAYKLRDEVRQNPDLLKSNYFSAVPTAAEPVVSTPVARTELDEGESLVNTGEDSIETSVLPGGPIERFGNIDPQDKRRLGPAIIEFNATKVLRAYHPGKVGDIEYQRHYSLAYSEFGEIAVFDENHKMVGDPIIYELPGRKKRPDEIAVEDAWRREQEIRLNITELENRKDELVKIYQTEFYIPHQKQKAAGMPRNNRLEMAAIKHKDQIKKIDREIAAQRAKLKTQAVRESEFYANPY